MKTPLLGALALFIVLSPAAARERAKPDHIKPDAGAILAPLQQAATDCFAETVMANPGAVAHARAGRWFQAAGVIGFLCRPEVDAMVAAHDRVHGRGAGNRYFKGAYARHLDAQLALRLQPLLERKTLASAEPPAGKAAEDAAGE